MGKKINVPKILIAEDEEELRELYTLRLEYESFNVVFAADGEEALEKVEKERPDLVLLDIMMPKKSGLEVLKELKNNPSTQKTPVIMLTVLPQEKTKDEALKLGASHYLVKSQIMPPEVVKLIKEVLSFR